MKKIILSIEGMSCSACSSGLEKYLNKQEGVSNAIVNLVMAQASIEYEDNLTIDDLNRFVHDAGYKSLGEYSEVSEKKSKKNNYLLIIFTVLSVLVLYIAMSHMIGLPVIPFINMMDYPINYGICLLILTIPFLIYGKDIFKNGFKNLIHKNPNMDTLVSIGVIASFLYSLFGTIMIILGNTEYVENLYFESSCIVIYFIKLGRFIDSNTKEKTKSAIKDLVTITPSKALLKHGKEEIEVTIDEVKEKNILVCKPGMKVAVDGIITKGTSHFDESFITGESMPCKKGIGDTVAAGSLNIDGTIEYSAERIGRDSTISEIVRLVVDATNTKAQISKIADKVCTIFVPAIMLIAILTLLIYLALGFGVNDALTHFVTVLVVACPCALGLATPLAMVVSVGTCAKNGILVKSNEILERTEKIDTIVFDKTGTLTEGALSVSQINNYSKKSNDEILNIVSSIEALSDHPIAKAFNGKTKYDVTNFKNLDGFGVTGVIDKKVYYIGNNKLIKKLKIDNKYTEDEKKLSSNGNSIVYVIEDKKIISLIGVKDVVRDNTVNVINELKKNNINVIMLTGDNEYTARKIADEVGIDEVIANVLPKDKTDVIKRLLSEGKHVMMVGDGINDAPSLATATVGVSVSSGTDIANNSADIILMIDNLECILKLIKISKKTVRNIKQNLFLAFFYNVCMIPIAIGVIPSVAMNPMIAAFAMTLSSITVMLNALRLKNINFGGEK